MKVVYSPSHLLHNPEVEIERSSAHSPFEHTGRAEKIRETLANNKNFEFVAPTAWGTEPITKIHNPGLLRFLSTAWADYQRDIKKVREVVPDMFFKSNLREHMGDRVEPASINGKLGWWCFETTTPLTMGTYEAARGAVDVAISATKIVLDGAKNSYGLCRPPGHHATTDLYGGYCFFNNAAIAAHHVASTTGTKVTVLDVDYHHGNGTQQIFYERDDVQFVSLHGDPTRAYPYFTGYEDEIGSGKGRGSTLNVPLAARTDDDLYMQALERACESIKKFGPSMVIVSLGLDTFITDPISDLALTTPGYDRCGALVGALGLPTVVLQEGGYDVNALGANVQSWLQGLARINN